MEQPRRFVVANAITATVLFLGGAACIVWSINVKTYHGMSYDATTRGVVTRIAPLAFSFEYAYAAGNATRATPDYSGTWLTVSPFENTSLAIAYASAHPECSLVANVPGAQTFGFCGPLMSVPWFWPLLMTVGIATMSIGSLLGFVVVQRVIM
jgi:hypothetical protein